MEISFLLIFFSSEIVIHINNKLIRLKREISDKQKNPDVKIKSIKCLFPSESHIIVTSIKILDVQKGDIIVIFSISYNISNKNSLLSPVFARFLYA